MPGPFRREALDPLETSLYKPIKDFLTRLGLDAKGEVHGCDIVATSGVDPVTIVIVEMKQSFNLELVLQGVERTAACDEVWLAVRASKRRMGREYDRRVWKLCRFLGFGLLAVASNDRVEVLVEPAPWKPRKDGKRRSRIVEEHRRRVGDPSLGGSTRQPIMTAYRQQALQCARILSAGPGRPRDLKRTCPAAAKILQRNVYSWFEREGRGLYRLTDAGRAALDRWDTKA